MATAQFQLSVRKPLQPKNTTTTGNDINVALLVNKEGSKSKSKPNLKSNSNKENQLLNPILVLPDPNPKYATPTKKVEMEVEALEMGSSLAEELSAIRKRVERLRLDKEKTEKMLKEREALLHFQMKELEDRGLFQKQLENEVDRLFRLKELKSFCMRISPIKSLRERQLEDKRISGGKSLSLSLAIKDDDDDDAEADSAEESVDENTLQSPAPSDSSEFLRDKSNDD